MDPLNLREIEESTRDLPLLKAVKAERGMIPQIFHLIAYKPDANRHLAQFTESVMRGPSPLSPGLRELIAAFTSGLNRCPFWLKSHAAVAAELLGDARLVEAAVADYRTAPLRDAEKALLAFVEKVNSHAPDMTRGDIEAALAAGWTEEALYDAITVCSLFNFYNRWCDAAGVHPTPDEVLARSAKKMASRGYAM